MKAMIFASVPTQHTRQSLRMFNLDLKDFRSGKTVAYKEFDSVSEAQQHLKDLADNYEWGFKGQKSDCYDKNSLKLDSIRAVIYKGSEVDELKEEYNLN